MRTFLAIMRDWKITTATRITLLGTTRTTYYQWRRNPERARLSRDQVERLSYIFGIYKALQILFPAPENADGWVKRENTDPPFGGRRPIDLMREGLVADLYRVRRYLDGARGW